MTILKPTFIILIILIAWQLLVTISNIPAYILPTPTSVIGATVSNVDTMWAHAIITFIEMISGLIIGTILGSLSALILCYYRPVRQWLMPILVISQAIPVFALAPILVLWLGYGMISKVAMAVLIIYFPVTAAFFDGLKNTNHGYVDLSHTMGASKRSTLIHIKMPAALPAFASGLRVATAMAPIGAIVGEWVGSSEGLGYLMIRSKPQFLTELVFASIFILSTIGIGLFLLVGILERLIIPWSRFENSKD